MAFLTLTVTSFNGAPLPSPLAASFDETGGEIGRAETNTLVLPDPERTISRVHARVVFRGSAYALIDEGSNAVHVNGQALGKGREAALRPGDRVQIGGYLIEVSTGTAAGGKAADPFADFFGVAPASPAAAGSADPLGLFSPPPSPMAARPTPLGFAPPPAPAFPPPAAPAAVGGIPDDWDPFAPSAPTPARPAPTPAAQALGLDFGAGAPAPLIPDLPRAGGGGGDSLDALFGLGAPGPARGNPLANSLLDAPVAQPNMAAHADPMRSLGSLAPSTAETRGDDVSDLNRPFIPPTMAPGLPPASVAPHAPSTPPAAPVLSWDSGGAGSRTIIRPGAKSASAPATFAPGVPPAAAPTPAPAPVAAAPTGSSAELLDAFRQGLGQPGLNLPALSPELMRLVGELLKEATQGTVDLLVARAALKREVRAQATMIVAKENNPLKFSPSAEAAMAHLLGPQVRGFMPAQQAMRDAFDDLRAHQIAFLAGMRAALEGLLARFDPAALESHLSAKSVLGSLLPNARKAQLWGVFQQEYAQIAREASDDFQQLFGREFLKAYEEQVDQLKQK